MSADVTVGRWQSSSTLTVAVANGDAVVRVLARRTAGGSVEVGLQRLGAGGDWGARMLPRLRFMSADVTVGRWQSSSTLTVAAPGAGSSVPPVPTRPPGDPPEGPPLGLFSPTGVPVVVLGSNGSTYTVRTPCGTTAELSGGTSIYRTQVVIDPGHGGRYDTGAVGPNGLAESDLNLTLSRAVVGELIDRGISAVLTRTGSYSMQLSQRAALADALQADALVSIHHNGPTYSTGSKPGTEVFVQSATRSEPDTDSTRLGGLLYEEITAALSGFGGIAWSRSQTAGVLRVLRPNNQGSSSGNPDAFGMLRRPNTTAVLVEYGYLSNAPEAELFATDEYIEVAAEATADAIETYLSTNRDGTGFSQYTRAYSPSSAPSRCDEVALE